ncbi:MAG: hypothetical protein JNK43_03910 [Ignavibacteria bacterium]|nr:hypothetical protein [Ignavibacteria bacterium]
MDDSKCIAIMKFLTRDELKELGRFVVSPFFNRLNDVTGLFNILKKYHPEYPAEAVDKRKMFMKLFPGKPYNDSRMRNLISDLGQLTEKFLQQKSWTEENYYKDIIYHSYLLNRGMFSLFERSYKKVSLKQPDEEIDTHYKSYAMEFLLHSYYLYTNRQHKAGENLYKTYDSLAGFYLDTMVRGLYNFKVRKSMYDYEKPDSLFREFASHFDFNGFRLQTGFADKNEFVFINIQYHFFEMLNGIDFEDNFNSLLNLLTENEPTLTRQLKYDTYNNLNNILAIMINEEGKDYSGYRLRIIKDTVSKNLYYPYKKHPVMPILIFLTGVNLAIQAGETDYAVYLYENYLPVTLSGSRDSLGNYTLAYIEFSKGNFDKGLELVNKVEYEVVPLRRHVKNLTLLLYYELGHFDSAESLVISYTQYIRRTEGFKGMYGPWYENFLKFYSELLELKVKGQENLDYKNIQGLQARLNNTVKVSFKTWLLEKTEQLIKN